jgi:hypothetical protein
MVSGAECEGCGSVVGSVFPLRHSGETRRCEADAGPAMSFVSTLEFAREFLLLPADLPPREVLQAAIDRRAELRAKSNDSKSTAIGRQGATKKLKQLEPLLPVLEIESELAALELDSTAPFGPQIHKLRLAQKQLSDRVGALPAGDERTILQERLGALQEALHPPAKAIVPERDPALDTFEQKIGALRTALEQNEKSKLRLAGLLAEARGIASVLRDATARTMATAELEVMARAVEERLAVATTPPFPIAPSKPAAPEPPPAIAQPESIKPEAARPRPPTPPAPPVINAIPKPAAKPVIDERAPERGTVLRLIPKTGTMATGPLLLPLRFVARPRFLLGREETERPSRADFLVPRMFGKVGRGNALLSRKDDDIMIQDGDGERKSTNGSKLDDEVLTTIAVPASFAHERTILLSQVFAITAQHLPGDAPAGPPLDDAPVSNTGRTVLISAIHGAMRFTPKEAMPLPVVAVWLFTDATIGSAAACAVTLSGSGVSDRHARVHFWQDAFWIENLRSGVGVRIGEQALAKGKARPLRHGDVLHFGPLAYDVAIES